MLYSWKHGREPGLAGSDRSMVYFCRWLLNLQFTVTDKGWGEHFVSNLSTEEQSPSLLVMTVPKF